MVRGCGSGRGRGRATNYGRGRGANSGRSSTNSAQREVQEEVQEEAANYEERNNGNEPSGDETPTNRTPSTEATPPSISSRVRGANQGHDIPTDEAHRQIIKLHSDSFHPVSVTRTIGTIIRAWIREPWMSWTQVPQFIRGKMWESFKLRFAWNQPTELIEDTFFKKCTDLYSSILYNARHLQMKKLKKTHISETKGHPPPWMHGNIWDAMVDEWTKEEWQQKSRSAKQSRLTEKDGGITKHTTGSIPIVEHSLRLAEKLGRKPNNYETFEYVHKRRGKEGSGEYVDSKSKRVCEDYVASLSNKYGPDSSSQPDFDPEVWIGAAGASTKSRVYGFGTGKYAKSMVKSVGSVTSEYPGASSSELRMEDNLQRIRDEVREEVRQELQQEMEERIRKANEDIKARCRAMILQLTKQASSTPSSAPSE